MRAHAKPMRAHAGPCGPMRAHASPCQAHAKPMPSPCGAHMGSGGGGPATAAAAGAGGFWFLDIAYQPRAPRCWVRAGICYSAAALLLPCSFNCLEGVQGPPAPPLLLAPLLLSPLLLPSFLLAPLLLPPLLLPPLLLPPLLLSPLALPPTPCHSTTISNRRHFFPTTKTTRFRQSHARSTRVFVVAHVTVEAHRTNVVNLGGV